MPEITLASTDRLFLFGHGLFETMLITPKGPSFLDLHWQRLENGAEILSLDLPPYETVAGAISDSVRKQGNSPVPYALRLTLSGGSPEHGEQPRLFTGTRPLPYTSDQYLSGISLQLLPWRKNEYSPLTNAKTVNYSENYLGKKEALRLGCDEGLWLNSKSYLSEGTMSNLFFIRNGELFTPDLKCGCLPGTRREIVLRLVSTLGLALHEGEFTLEELLQAEEVFMTNALMGIMPVHRLNSTLYKVAAPDDRRSVTRKLARAYQELL
ncbi:MAG: aminotransferase class IV [Desulfitobacteriaceae bacterium]